jgi:hypothetical protein
MPVSVALLAFNPVLCSGVVLYLAFSVAALYDNMGLVR